MSILGYNFALCVGIRVTPLIFERLYHGTDAHEPVSVGVAGLPPRGPDIELLHHAEPPPGNTGDSAFRGCTQSFISMLQDSGAALWGQWIYEIRNYPGYDVVSLLEGRIRCPGGFRGVVMTAEQEIAIPAEVPLGNISRAGVVRSNTRGQTVVDFITPWP